MLLFIRNSTPEHPGWEKIKYVIHRKSKNRGSDTKIIVTIFFGLYTSYTDSGNRTQPQAFANHGHHEISLILLHLQHVRVGLFQMIRPQQSSMTFEEVEASGA